MIKKVMAAALVICAAAEPFTVKIRREHSNARRLGWSQEAYENTQNYAYFVPLNVGTPIVRSPEVQQAMFMIDINSSSSIVLQQGF